MTITQVVIYGAAVAVAYTFVASRLLAIGSHFRARALDLGTDLLQDDRVPDAVKESIERWLCDIPRVAYAWGFNLLLLPAVFIVVLSRWRGKPVEPPPHAPTPSAPYWKTWDDFTTMAIIATLCNSPLAFVLGVVQGLFVVSFVSGNYVIWATVNRMFHKDRRDGWLHRHAH